jgi:hypothetical protein
MQTLNDMLDDGEDDMRISRIVSPLYKQSNLDNSQSRARRKQTYIERSSSPELRASRVDR